MTRAPLSTRMSVCDVPLAVIAVSNRLRDVDPVWAKGLAATMSTVGLKQPIEVAEHWQENGFGPGLRYRLIAGAHRLFAAGLLRWKTIPARIVQVHESDDPTLRLYEALENLMRAELTALDRMAHLDAAKTAHDALFPDAGKRGRRKKATVDADPNGNCATFAQFSFPATVADRCGFGRRLVEHVLRIWRALSEESRQRLRGTTFAHRQTELQALAAEPHGRQSAILDLLLSTPPGAASVAEAVAVIDGRRADTETDRHFKLAVGALGRLPEARRIDLLAHYEDDVRAFARSRGWLS